MTSSFKTHIQSALADDNLQKALDGNAERRIQARLTALGSLDDPEGMRQRAHAMRAEVIAHLDSYLEQFIAQVTANGITVHRAADAAQAVGIIFEIARQASDGKPVTIAKSKTMVSEEIHLNHALEQAGMRPVETDLGEYIVQLRGEPPSHIITPAVHLRRQQVGQLFHEKLGVPYTEQIPEMTNTARRALRQVFLEAQVGLSGVNFGVAQTGSLVLMTNEGNGRMVTTLPRVHIALMGMERLVPTLDDLALVMALLPRFGTGQKITVYASLVHAPRRVGEIDGAQERHLVIVDNGRSRVQQSVLSEVLYCIRCGACLNACPVFREIGGHAYVGIQGDYSIYPGPVGSVLSAALFGSEGFGHLARASSLCGACKDACPVGVDLPKLLLRVRAGMADQQAIDNTQTTSTSAPAYLQLGIRLFRLAATHPRLFRLAQRFAGAGSRILAPRSGWLRLPALTGWGYNKDFPAPAVKSFQARWRQNSRLKGLRDNGKGRGDLKAGDKGTKEQGIRDKGEAGQGFSIPGDPSPRNEPLSPASSPLATSLFSRFKSELEDLGGKVTACREAELAGKILDLLREKELRAAAAWEDAHLPLGLAQALRRGGIQVSHTPDAQLKVGITGALAGVAETGTVVIAGGPGRPLTASLLPEIHIAVLREADIHANLSQVLNLREVREASSVVLVSGPSRTADIEMTLTIGVHGPGEVHVFCVG